MQKSEFQSLRWVDSRAEELFCAYRDLCVNMERDVLSDLALQIGSAARHDLDVERTVQRRCRQIDQEMMKLQRTFAVPDQEDVECAASSVKVISPAQ